MQEYSKLQTKLSKRISLILSLEPRGQLVGGPDGQLMVFLLEKGP